MNQSDVIEALSPHLRHWSLTSLGVKPIDRKAAEPLIQEAYAATGLAPPTIIWCKGPLEIGRRLAAECGKNDLGPNIKDRLYDDIVAKAEALADIFWNDIADARARLAGRITLDGGLNDYGSALRLAADVSRVVHQGVDNTLFATRLRARHFVQRLRGSLRVLPSASFADYAISPREFILLGVYDFLVRGVGWDAPRPIKSVAALGNALGWTVPYEAVCFASERPTALHCDDRARLHNASGPALAFADDLRVYAWKGVEVSRPAIEESQRLSVRDIDTTWDPTLRNTLIEIMSPQRFVALGGARRVAKDETGTLWRQEWHHAGVRTGVWCAVEVIDGTPGPNGEKKRYFLRVPSRMRSALEAVAWTYGLSPRQYSALVLRT
jgi:hypothetical protein